MRTFSCGFIDAVSDSNGEEEEEEEEEEERLEEVGNGVIWNHRGGGVEWRGCVCVCVSIASSSHFFFPRSAPSRFICTVYPPYLGTTKKKPSRLAKETTYVYPRPPGHQLPKSHTYHENRKQGNNTLQLMFLPPKSRFQKERKKTKRSS
jgi:hypothetical protein